MWGKKQTFYVVEGTSNIKQNVYNKYKETIASKSLCYLIQISITGDERQLLRMHIQINRFITARSHRQIRRCNLLMQHCVMTLKLR